MTDKPDGDALAAKLQKSEATTVSLQKTVVCPLPCMGNCSDCLSGSVKQAGFELASLNTS